MVDNADKVLCRFQVTGIQLVPDKFWRRTDTGKVVSDGRTISAQVRLQGVPSPPFGESTPSASIEMLIRRPEAARVFEQAFREFALQGDAGGQFDVLFTWRPLEQHRGAE